MISSIFKDASVGRNVRRRVVEEKINKIDKEERFVGYWYHVEMESPTLEIEWN